MENPFLRNFRFADTIFVIIGFCSRKFIVLRDQKFRTASLVQYELYQNNYE